MHNLIYLTYLDDSLSLAEKLIFEMPNIFDFYIAKSFSHFVIRYIFKTE